MQVFCFKQILNFAQFLNAVRADILTIERHKALCAFAKDTCGLILAENNTIPLNIYLQ